VSRVRAAASAAYRFKPGRTFAQALGATLAGNGIGVLDLDWVQALSVSGLAAVLSLLQIWGEGGEMLAEEERVSTKLRGYGSGV
jgi:hypothetical protein